MKKIKNSLLFLAALLSLAACTEDMNYKDAEVTAVNKLYEPAANKQVELQSSATASLFFEWAPAYGEDGGAPLYEVLFDKTDGDFSDPIYTVTSDDNGVRPHATISHKTLNRVGALAGLSNGETGTVKWTVRSSRGINVKTASVSNNLTITRLLGFDEIPTQLFIYGDAVEGGKSVEEGLACASPEADVYEVFVSLEAGKTFAFASHQNADASFFSLDDTAIKEGATGATVEKTGIYRIKLDFSVASVVTMREVGEVYMYFCPTNSDEIKLDYIGNGVWQGQGVVQFKQEGWGRDERYKFHMYYADGAKLTWGTFNDTDSNPGAAPADDPYFYIKETADNQWDQKWKFTRDHDGAADGANPGAVTLLKLIFNTEHYTHFVGFAE